MFWQKCCEWGVLGLAQQKQTVACQFSSHMSVLPIRCSWWPCGRSFARVTWACIGSWASCTTPCWGPGTPSCSGQHRCSHSLLLWCPTSSKVAVLLTLKLPYHFHLYLKLKVICWCCKCVLLQDVWNAWIALSLGLEEALKVTLDWCMLLWVRYLRASAVTSWSLCASFPCQE